MDDRQGKTFGFPGGIGGKENTAMARTFAHARGLDFHAGRKKQKFSEQAAPKKVNCKARMRLHCAAINASQTMATCAEQDNVNFDSHARKAILAFCKRSFFGEA